MDRTLCVLAAGMGSRFGGLKQTAPVGPSSEVVLDYSVFDALRAGFTKAVFVIRREMEKDFREAICPRFEKHIEIAFAYQDLHDLPAGFSVPEGREKPWGTGHALRAARKKIGEPFLAINADDFYGRTAFSAIADFLAKPISQKNGGTLPEFALVGYRLGDTLSEHGTVSRGVCRATTSGLLQGITEMTKIGKTENSLMNREDGAPEIPLSGEESVSMNFWGFLPSFFPLLEERFTAFLESEGTSAKNEFYLPYAVTDLVASGRAQVRLLQGGKHWFGITYPGDKDAVVAAVPSLVENGEYPANLWDK